MKGLTLRKLVSDVRVCMFYVCKVTGFVDWLDRGLIYMWEEFGNVYLLMTWVWLSWGDPVWLTGHENPVTTTTTTARKWVTSWKGWPLTATRWEQSDAWRSGLALILPVFGGISSYGERRQHTPPAVTPLIGSCHLCTVRVKNALGSNSESRLTGVSCMPVYVFIQHRADVVFFFFFSFSFFSLSLSSHSQLVIHFPFNRY